MNIFFLFFQVSTVFPTPTKNKIKKNLNNSGSSISWSDHPSVCSPKKKTAEVYSIRGEVSDLYVCFHTHMGIRFRSASVNTVQSQKLNIYIFGIIFMCIHWFLRRLSLTLSLFLVFTPLQLWCIFMRAVGVLHQLFVPAYFQINSVCKSIHACNYCRLRDRSIDSP